MKPLVAEAWVEQPLERFVRDTRARFAMVLRTNGQVLGQYGFTRAVDVMSACALAAAIHGSSEALGRELDGAPFRELYHAGAQRQVFLAATAAARGPVLLFCAFDAESSLGLVRMYFQEFRRAVLESAPEAPPPPVRFGADLERELHHNLAVLFGRGRQTPTA